MREGESSRKAKKQHELATPAHIGILRRVWFGVGITKVTTSRVGYARTTRNVSRKDPDARGHVLLIKSSDQKAAAGDSARRTELSQAWSPKLFDQVHSPEYNRDGFKRIEYWKLGGE
jgi:hypothetical protein